VARLLRFWPSSRRTGSGILWPAVVPAPLRLPRRYRFSVFPASVIVTPRRSAPRRLTTSAARCYDLGSRRREERPMRRSGIFERLVTCIRQRRPANQQYIVTHTAVPSTIHPHGKPRDPDPACNRHQAMKLYGFYYPHGTSRDISIGGPASQRTPAGIPISVFWRSNTITGCKCNIGHNQCCRANIGALIPPAGGTVSITAGFAGCLHETRCR